MGLLDFNIGDILKPISTIIDDLTLSKEEKANLKHKVSEASHELQKMQFQINIEEAKHQSRFVAGWRPFIGWVGGCSLAYQFLIYPLLCWGIAILAPEVEAPPVFESGPLFAIVTGMLGIGGMRSWDKAKKVDTKGIK